jgi:hypothetical protein
MTVNLEKLNRLALANEERLRNAKNADVERVAACYAMRASLAKVAREAGLVRSFDNTFRLPMRHA